jgi:hypothetical protein
MLQWQLKYFFMPISIPCLTVGDECADIPQLILFVLFCFSWQIVVRKNKVQPTRIILPTVVSGREEDYEEAHQNFGGE